MRNFNPLSPLYHLNPYLIKKAIVAMMTLVKAVATQEDYSFPKAVKQGLSHVTRVTAEVARLWSNSTFAEEGYHLGRV